MDLSSRPRPTWLPLLQILALLGAMTLLYFSSVSALFERWTRWDESLSHSLPTLGIFLFLAWRAQPWGYRADSRGARLLLLALLVLGSIAWLMFDKIQIGILAYLALLALLVLAIAAAYSFKTALYLLPCLGILIFTIPIWEFLTNTLVDMSAYAVGWLGELIDIAILIDGNNIFIPSGRLYIDDGCSGLRYLVVALLMAYLLSCINHYRPRQIVIAVVIAACLALLTNWIRIFALVMIGYYTEMQSSLMHDHETFGWVLFASIMLPAIYFAPVYRRPVLEKSQQPLAFKPVLPLVCMAVGPLLALFFNTLAVSQPLANLNGLQPQLTYAKPAEQFVRINAPEGGVRETQVYKQDEVFVAVDLAQYPQKDPNQKLVPYFGSLYDRTSWVLIEEKPHDSLANLGAKISLYRRVNSRQQVVLLHRYQVGSYATSGYEQAKLLQLPAVLFGNNNFNIFVAQAVCTSTNCEQEVAAILAVAKTWVNAQEQ